MKKLFLVLATLVLALGGQAQSLQGWFLTTEKDQGFQSDLFHFAENRFFYRSSGCLGSTIGHGTFAVRADRLLLYFEKSPADTGRVKATLPCPSVVATPNFCFLVIDKPGGGSISGATIISKKTGIGATTTSGGGATFSYSLPPNDVLTVKSVGYNSVDIPLPAAISQGFVVKLGPPYYFNSGDTLTFQLKKVHQHSFALRPFYDGADADDEKLPYTRCGRITTAEAKKITEWQAPPR